MYFVINLPDIYSGYDPETDIDYKFWWISSIGTNMIKKPIYLLGATRLVRCTESGLRFGRNIRGSCYKIAL